MPETEDTAGTERPAAGPVQKRVRRHRRRPLVIRYWRVIPIVIFAAVAPAIWNLLFRSRSSYDLLPGYSADTTKVEEEYVTFTGKPVDPALTGDFDRATRLVRSGNYGKATVVLESAARNLPVPAVFNDLGVLYAKLKDGPHALRAFRDALARDHDYAPVRANLKKLHMPEAVDPDTNELEPNNDNTQANAVWLDRPVRAAITPSLGDVDCFWFITPRPPRDRISVAVISQSVTLIPRMRIYDQNGNLVTGLKEATNPGGGVRFDFSPPPNRLYYVQVDGVSNSSGSYVLTVSALHAYDGYEPNDTILTATRIVPAQTVEANIMDSDDTDFYSFVSGVAGTVKIDVVSRTDALLLGMGTFAPDLQNIGFAPDSKAPGKAIHYQLQVEANQLYYLQVFSRNDTTGPYSLVVK
jgi:hypothetical protein